MKEGWKRDEISWKFHMLHDKKNKKTKHKKTKLKLLMELATSRFFGTTKGTKEHKEVKKKEHNR